MAVLFDAVTFSSLLNPTADTSFTHTPVGIPKAVLFVGLNYNSSTDVLSGGFGVTYGGVSLNHLVFLSPLQATLGGELDGWLYTMSIVSNDVAIPTGPQSVIVDTTSSSGQFRCGVFTMTATNDAQIETYAALSNQTSANPSVALTIDENSFVVGHILSGFDSAGPLSVASGHIERGLQDFGVEVWNINQRTTNPTTNTTLDWTATAEDWSAVAIAFSEPPVGDVINHDRHRVFAPSRAMHRSANW